MKNKKQKVTTIRPDIFELISMVDETDYIKIILLGILTAIFIFFVIIC